MNAVDQFREAIRSSGVTPPDNIQADNRLHRFPPNGKRGDDAAWYVLHGDGIPAGAFGDWRSGEFQSWRANIGRKLTRAEAAAHRAKVEAMRHEREAEEIKHEAAARQRAKLLWVEAKDCEMHPYLTRKGIAAHGTRLIGADLVMPLRDTEGVIQSLQTIAPYGDKRFMAGGRVRGCYFSIGNIKGAKTLCIAEGFATAASIYEATQHPVAVAFNAGNLLSVSQALRKKYSDLRLILCADDDYRTEGNPGLMKATEAARAVGGMLVVPDFGEDRPEGVTDFNDMAQSCGADAVKQVIESARPSEEADCHAGNGSVAAGDLCDWPDPMPLPDTLPLVSPFDFDLLPNTLRPWIQDIAERVQCPPDFPAVGAMISLAAVVGRKIGIRPKRQDDWLEVPNLWGAIVGRPGVMKSPALRESMRPLGRLEAQAREGYEEDHAVWQRARELHKVKSEANRAEALKAFKNKKPVDADALAGDFAEDEPQARRYVVNDCSVEALGVILQGNPNGTLAYRDELIGLLKSLDKEGNEGARGFFLSAWSGIDPYTFDRIGRGLNMRIGACCLSLLGSIQPSIIGGYLRQAVISGGGDGLLSRFQLLVWPDIAGEWRDVDRWPDTEAKATAYATFERLDSLNPAGIGATIEEGSVPYLRFDSEAQALFSEWRRDFEHRIRSGNDHAAFESHLSKYRKLVPALALLIHLADNDKPVAAIGETALLKALAWADYLESHARRAYASVTQAEAESARALLHRIRRGEVSNPFVPRDVYLKHWAHLSKPEEVHEAVQLLGDLDYLRKEEQFTGGRPKGAIWINPKAKVA